MLKLKNSAIFLLDKTQLIPFQKLNAKNNWFICQFKKIYVILRPNPIMWRQHIKYGGKNY